MSTTEIQATIKQLLIDELQVDATLLTNADATTPLLGRGIGLDSVEAMRLGLAIENTFNISIPDADLTADLFSSLGTLAVYVQNKTSQLESTL